MRKLLLAPFGVILFFLACSKNSGVDRDCERPCNDRVFCTDVVVTIDVKVENESGSAINLEAFEVVRQSDKKVIHKSTPSFAPQIGTYQLFSDSFKDETTRCGENFEFKGFLGGKQIVSRVYKIGHDCCHIYLIAGDTRIVIKQ